MSEGPEILPRQSAGARLLKFLPQGKQAVLLLTRLVPMLREVAPLLEGLLGGAMGAQAGQAGVKQIEARLGEHLAQTSSAIDQQAEEVRFRLKEQNAATARLEQEVRAMRDALATDARDRGALRQDVLALQKSVKLLGIGLAVCVLLLCVVLWAVLRHS